MFAAFRTAARATAGRRLFATAAPGQASKTEFEQTRHAIEHHAAQSAELWRKITYYVAFPAIIIALLNAKNLAEEHEAHLEHMKEENGGELPERIVYGTYTPFYNPRVNIPIEGADE
ncbi:hypothetical protein BMF94_0678 [Rhodotorula taiwanensis]|uniref:Uncharacterized protein n=1 Tax=Rhodotorula taiwanensis TaxID=741276 RepID=A0A2S5BI86_9BASI|nr:hypothetical protein BMF94_0678 [Rhodotorula taiwanensis]